MTADSIALTGHERTFDDSEIIVSKTDLKGRITYANRVFLRLAGYDEPDVIGAPHSLVRHPEMPRCVFKLLWDTIAAGKEIFAYVVNRAKNGDHYWVFAHVTPSRDASGNVIGYHSNRRVADKRTVREIVVPLYKTLLAEEKKHANRKEGMNAGYELVSKLLKEKGVAYDEFVFSL